MRIVHVTAGAGGRICGSCLHDNALVRALRDRGRDAKHGRARRGRKIGKGASGVGGLQGGMTAVTWRLP